MNDREAQKERVRAYFLQQQQSQGSGQNDREAQKEKVRAYLLKNYPEQIKAAQIQKQDNINDVSAENSQNYGPNSLNNQNKYMTSVPMTGIAGLPAEADPRLKKMTAQALARGAVGFADFPEMIAKFGRFISGANLMDNPPAVELGLGNQIKDYLAQKGVDIESEQGQGLAEKMYVSAMEFLGGTLAGGAVGSTAQLANKIPQVSKVAGPALQGVQKVLGSFGQPGMAQTAGLATAAGAGSGALEHAGVPQPYAALASSLVTPSAANFGSKLANKAFGPKVKPINEASQFLGDVVGQENIPQVISNIERNAGRHPEGYKPMTAELAENPELSALHQARQGSPGPEGSKISRREIQQYDSLEDAMQGLAPQESDFAQTQGHIKAEKQRYENAAEKRIERRENKLEKAVKEIEHNPEANKEAGKTIREKEVGNLKTLKGNRYEQTHPLYEKIQSDKTPIPRTNIDSYIQSDLNNFRGKPEQAGRQVGKNVQTRHAVDTMDPEIGLSELKVKYPDEYKAIVDNLSHKELGAHHKAQYEIKQGKRTKITRDELQSTPGELMAARQAARKAWESAKSSGQNQVAHVLNELIERIDMDITAGSPKSAELLKDANSIYRKYSKEIDTIEGHRAMGKDVEKYWGLDDFVKGERELVDKYLKGTQSEKNAQDLLKQFGNDKEGITKINSAIEQSVMDHIIDPNTGQPNVNKMAQWLKDHPGAKEIYPHIETKLANAQNARKFVREAQESYSKNLDKFTKSATSELLHENTNNIVNNIFGKKNPLSAMDEILHNVNKDKTGAAKEGLKRLFIENLSDATKNQGVAGKAVSLPKFQKYYDKHRDVYAKLFDENQMNVLDKVHEALKGKRSAYTLGNATNSSTLQKIEQAGRMPKVENKTLLNTLMSEGIDIIGHTIGLPAYAVKKIFGSKIEAWKKTKAENKFNEVREAIGEAMVDPERAKLLLQEFNPHDPKSVANFQKSLEKLKKNYRYGVYTGFMSANKEGED